MSEAKKLTHLAIPAEEREHDLDATLALAELSIAQLSGLSRAHDRALYRDIVAISQCISGMKSAILELAPSAIVGAHIPEAGRELKAVVEATENASNAIMERAEAILAADRRCPSYFATVEAHVTGIFEACAFQDITGQRISKVCEALDAIDRRVQKCMSIGASMGEADRREAEKEERRERLILNGPAENGDGKNQADIDAMFAA